MKNNHWGKMLTAALLALMLLAGSMLGAMAEDAGGRMEVFTEPAFCVEVTLPKEDDDGLSSDDCG